MNSSPRKIKLTRVTKSRQVLNGKMLPSHSRTQAKQLPRKLESEMLPRASGFSETSLQNESRNKNMRIQVALRFSEPLHLPRLINN